MAFLDFLKSKKPVPKGIQNPHWVRAPNGRFHRLLDIEPEEIGLNGLSAVYVVWHGGVRPQWVYVAATEDLAHSLEDALNDDEITEYEVNGRLWVTWSAIRKDFQDGVVLYLTQTMKPVVRNPRVKSDATPIAVYAPGSEPTGDNPGQGGAEIP